MNWFLVPFQVSYTILGTDSLPVVGMWSLLSCNPTRALIRGQSWKKRMRETRPLARPSPSATLSRHHFFLSFFFKRNLLVDFKDSSVSREIILVGSRGERGKTGRKWWGLWAGRDGGADGNQSPVLVQLVLWGQPWSEGLRPTFGKRYDSKNSEFWTCLCWQKSGLDREEGKDYWLFLEQLLRCTPISPMGLRTGAWSPGSGSCSAHFRCVQSGKLFTSLSPSDFSAQPLNENISLLLPPQSWQANRIGRVNWACPAQGQDWPP